jgi:hypothetical protein
VKAAEAQLKEAEERWNVVDDDEEGISTTAPSPKLWQAPQWPLTLLGNSKFFKTVKFKNPHKLDCCSLLTVFFTRPTTPTRAIE